MRKNILIFGVVTLVSLLVAAIGHAVYPPFCMLVKPMAWPFICLAVLVVKSLRENKQRRR